MDGNMKCPVCKLPGAKDEDGIWCKKCDMEWFYCSDCEIYTCGECEKCDAQLSTY